MSISRAVILIFLLLPPIGRKPPVPCSPLPARRSARPWLPPAAGLRVGRVRTSARPCLPRAAGLRVGRVRASARPSF